MLVINEQPPTDVTKRVNDELEHLRAVAATQRIDLGRLSAAEMLELDFLVNQAPANDLSQSAEV